MKDYPLWSVLAAIAVFGVSTANAFIISEGKDDKDHSFAHMVDCSLPSENIPMIQGINLPVYSALPTEPMSATAFIFPDGRVAGVISGKDPDKKALGEAIRNSEFSAPLLISKPAWCSVSINSSIYYYIDPDSKAEEGLTPPVCKFRLEPETIALIKLQAPVTEIDEAPSISFRFHIDKDGNTDAVDAMDPRGQKIVSEIFTPHKADYVFAPATVNGKPVASTLILHVEGMRKEESSNGQPPFMCEAEQQSLPKIRKAYEGATALKFKAFLTIGKDGMVTSVRLPGNLDAGIAISVMQKLRKWGNPAHFAWDAKLPVAVVELSLAPGETGFQLVGKGRPIDFTAPKIIEQGRFSNFDLTIDAIESNVMGYTINADGQAGKIEVIQKNNGKFSDRFVNMREDTTFEPASIEGQTVPCRIKEMCSLKNGEYWRNTDGLKF